MEQYFATPRYPLLSIAAVEQLLQYGCSARADYDVPGVRILRMNNLQDGGWVLDDVKRVELMPQAIDTWRLQRGDLVINRTNSKELVGKCEVFDLEGEWVFASYLMRLRVNEDLVLPTFLRDFLSTPAGRAQIDRDSRQIAGMTNINAEEIRGLIFPKPDLDVQVRLVRKMDAAREERRKKLRAADELLAGLDAYVLNQLGLPLSPPQDPSKPFAIGLSQVRGRRLDASAYIPFPVPRNPREIPISTLDVIADIGGNSAPETMADNAEVPYVGLPECDLNDVREVALRPYRDVRGRSVARVGDILFARIEPSVFNKKYVYVEHLAGYEYAFISTEFYTVRARGDEDDQRYLYAMLQSSFVYNQVRGKTTGSSGRRRIDPEMFASLLIPWPVRAVREGVAAEVSHRRNSALALREEAARIWEEAKRRFDDELLNPEIGSE